MKYLINALLICLLLMLKPAYADSETGWYMSASANLNFSIYSDPGDLDNQTELGVFIDADYLDNYGLAAGLITQNRGESSLDDISNGILYLGGRYHFYPELLPGKLTASLEAYDQTDVMEIISTAVSFINYKKSFYADLFYTESDYGSADPVISRLRVKQWAPTIGFSFNDQYDWLQLRFYNIDLSNDTRHPGVTKTTAGELKLTHWLKKREGRSLDRVQFIVLAGERIFAVDPDARKIYNFADMQTAAYSLGGTWKPSYSNEFYIYASVEEYREAFSNDNYSYVILYSGYKTYW